MKIMESIKIDNFNRENPKRTFPFWESLTQDESSHFREIIFNRLALRFESDSLVLVKRLEETACDVAKLESKASGSEILNILKRLEIFPRKYVYINWHRYDKIDKMKYLDFISYFEYIWYPSSDDIDIFDES